VRLKALETPGHTAESISLLVFDLDRSATEPHAVLNSKERPTLDEALARELNPLALDRVLALQGEGAQVLDTREPGDFTSRAASTSVWEGSTRRGPAPCSVASGRS